MRKKRSLKRSELFIITAGRKGNYYGILFKEKNRWGKPVVFGCANIINGQFMAQSTNNLELEKSMDELALMLLDCGLHSDAGVFTEFLDLPFYHN